jgi:hypothetical protein
MRPSDGAWDGTPEDVEAVIDTSGWSSGRHILFVRGQDADGNWGATSALFLAISSSANDVPLAAFDLRCRGTICEFDASRSFDRDGHIVTYVWAFGDGRSGYGPKITHSYVRRGTYPVTLSTIDDDRARGTQTQTVTIEQGQRILYLPLVHVERTDR